MKSYTITVNGNVYDVTVEETNAGAVAAAPRQAAPVAPKAAPTVPPHQFPSLFSKTILYFGFVIWKTLGNPCL